MKKILILFVIYVLICGFGWGVDNWGFKQYGNDKWNGIQWGESGVPVTPTFIFKDRTSFNYKDRASFTWKDRS